VHDSGAALAEINLALDYAREKGSAISVAKLLDLKCRLCGLIVQQAHLQFSEKPSIDTALHEARSRAKVINPPLLSGPEPVTDLFGD
jgi:hypothetical protein